MLALVASVLGDIRGCSLVCGCLNQAPLQFRGATRKPRVQTADPNRERARVID